jgi:hypothetical protein
VRWTVAVVALVLAGCSFLARDHPCWPYLVDRFGGKVPSHVVRRLAFERGARRRNGRWTAPIGFYWRKAEPAEDEEPLGGVAHEIQGDRELVPCPGAAQAENVLAIRRGTIVVGTPAAPPRRRALVRPPGWSQPGGGGS